MKIMTTLGDKEQAKRKRKRKLGDKGGKKNEKNTKVRSPEFHNWKELSRKDLLILLERKKFFKFTLDFNKKSKCFVNCSRVLTRLPVKSIALFLLIMHEGGGSLILRVMVRHLTLSKSSGKFRKMFLERVVVGR